MTCYPNQMLAESVTRKTAQHNDAWQTSTQGVHIYLHSVPFTYGTNDSMRLLNRGESTTFRILETIKTG